jgi:hypothetical protein
MLFGGSVRGIPFARMSPQHASESRRPRPPRHLLPTESRGLAGVCRTGKDPGPSPATRIREEERPLSGSVLLPPPSGVELAKPDYLRPCLSSLPKSQTSPPAPSVRET